MKVLDTTVLTLPPLNKVLSPVFTSVSYFFSGREAIAEFGRLQLNLPVYNTHFFY